MITRMQITTLDRPLPLRKLATLAGALALIVLPALQGCMYHMAIQQGNHLDATTVGQVKAGMTRAQVRYLLGTPMVPGGFSNERWDYDYYLKLKGNEALRFGQFLEQNKLKGMPEEPTAWEQNEYFDFF